MQNVSEEFKQEISQPSREIESRITFPDLVLDDYQIKSISLNSILVGSDDFEIGTAPMDMVKVELVEDTGDEWGRNLLLNTDGERTSTFSGWQQFFSSIKVGEYGLSEFKKGGTFTIKAYIKNIEGDESVGIMVHCLTSTTQTGYRQFSSHARHIKPNDEGYFEYTFNAPADENITNVYIATRHDSGSTGQSTVKFSEVKLEKGSITTPWTPAPEDYANYDYKDKECSIELGLTLPDESVEYVSMGKYTVEKANRKNNVITLDCVDRMYKAEKDYISDLMYPATLLDILQSACDQVGITLATTSFANADYTVPNEPVYEGVTCRKVFAQVAELAGGYAKINRLGQLEILTLGNESVRDITKDHYFDLKINEVAEASIDKVIVKVGEETATKGDGENIYTIVDNMFVQDPNNVVDALYSVLKNVSYTACTLKWQGDFSLDLGDKITIDGHDTYILDRNLKYTGGLRETYRAPAKSNIEKESTGKGSLTLDIANVKTQIKVIDGEIKQTIERVENLVVDAANRLYQSQTEIPFDLNIGTGTIQLFRDAIHPYYKVMSDTNIDLSASFPSSQYAEDLEGEEVTISLDVLVDVDRLITIDGREHEVRANRWTRVHVTKEFPANTTRYIRVRNPFSRKTTRDKLVGVKLIENLTADINVIYYRNLQVQNGGIPTNWTLTPEELEADVNRYKSEILQLEKSISLSVSAVENNVSNLGSTVNGLGNTVNGLGNDVDSLDNQVGNLSSRMSNAELKITPEAIVQAINTTDGVGRVKTVNFIVDETGATVENGALIVRDARNAAIITSDGLKAIYNLTSSGEYNGWQMVGIKGLIQPTTEKYQAGISAFIPENFIVESATLYTRSASSYLTGYQTTHGVPDGYYHGKNLGLYIMNTDAMIFDYPQGSSHSVWYGPAGIDITTPVWGSRWSPTGGGVKVKIGDVKDYLTPGEQTLFVVETSDNPSSNTEADFSLMKFDLVIEGFLRG